MPRRLRLTATLLAAAVAAVLAPAGSPALAATPARAATPFRIDQTHVGRAPLGKPAAFYTKAYASKARRYADDDGFQRLVFDDWHVAVLFAPGADVAVGVITWAARTTTSLGVGPCSSARTLQAAYRGKLSLVAHGSTVSAYRLGRLVFTVGQGGFVANVALLAQGTSVGVALAAPACGSPSVG